MTSNYNNFIIKSYGIGQIVLHRYEDECYQADHSSFNKLNEIPFFNFLCNLNALHVKYGMLQSEPFGSRLLRDLYVANIDLMKSFEKITDLCDDLYANGYIKDIIDGIQQISNYVDNVPFDFFDYDETKNIMDRIKIEIIGFSQKLENVLNYLKQLVDGNEAFIEILRGDFFNQLKNR